MTAEGPANRAEAPTRVRTVVSFGEIPVDLDQPTRLDLGDAAQHMPPTEPMQIVEADVTPAVEPGQPIRAVPGDVLRDRYRLDDLLVRRDESQTWRAFDQRLVRPVLVHLLPAGRPHNDLLDAARRAAVVTDYRILRVLDATLATEPEVADARGIGHYVVCEYAQGQTLADLLAGGPLSAAESARLVHEVADALIGMHAQGLYHRRLSPDTVVITPENRVKIVGFLLEAELAEGDRSVGSDAAADANANAEAADVRALGRLLRSATAGSTDAASSLAEVCDRILNPDDHANPLRTAADVSAALSRQVSPEDLPAEPMPVPTAHRPIPLSVPSAHAPRRTPGASRRTLRVALVTVLVLVGLIAGGLFLRTSPDLSSPGADPSQQWAITAARDFDPEGNGEERPTQVDRAWDGNPDTSWRTMNYWEAEIGNKTGVGLVFDLGEVRRVSRVDLDLDGVGTSLEVRIPTGDAAVSQPPMSGVGRWTVVGTAEQAPATTTVTLAEPVETRFLLVYLTYLPRDGSAYTGGIAEARFWS